MHLKINTVRRRRGISLAAFFFFLYIKSRCISHYMCLRLAEMQFSFRSPAYKFETTGLKGCLRRACRVRRDVRTCKSETCDGRGGTGEANWGGTASEEENQRARYWGRMCGRSGLYERECVCGMLPPDQVKPELETAHWIQRRRRCRRGGGSPGIRSHHSMAAGVNAPELRKWRLNSLWKCGQ